MLGLPLRPLGASAPWRWRLYSVTGVALLQAKQLRISAISASISGLSSAKVASRVW